LAAVPKPEIGPWQGTLLQGEPPRPDALPSGCRFRLRCPYAQDDPCAQREPTLHEVAHSHMVACHFAPRTSDFEGVRSVPSPTGRGSEGRWKSPGGKTC